MRMYVIVVIAALLLLLAGIVAQLVRTGRAEKAQERKQKEANARLEAKLDQAAREYQERVAAAEASGALTAVMPAIQVDSHAPRKVA